MKLRFSAVLGFGIAAALVAAPAGVQASQAQQRQALLSQARQQPAPIVRFMQVAPGVFRGGQPDSQAAYLFLRKVGVRTIINLRRDNTVSEEAAIAKRLGLIFRSYPMNPWERPDDREVAAILHDMKDPSLFPVFIHCQHGKDRTGLLVGLYRVFVQNWTAQNAYEEMRRIGFSRVLFRLDDYFWDKTKGH